MNTPLSNVRTALLKLAARVPFMHGTNQAYPLLKPAAREKVLASDPNPRAVYVMLRRRGLIPSAGRFADKAAAKYGGEPTIVHGKMDTRKGWMPVALTDWGKSHLDSVEELRDIVHELDDPRSTRQSRAELWRTINKGAGAWRNNDLLATLRTNSGKKRAEAL